MRVCVVQRRGPGISTTEPVISFAKNAFTNDRGVISKFMCIAGPRLHGSRGERQACRIVRLYSLIVIREIGVLMRPFGSLGSNACCIILYCSKREKVFFRLFFRGAGEKKGYTSGLKGPWRPVLSNLAAAVGGSSQSREKEGEGFDICKFGAIRLKTN